jgi:hypothetical protein
MTELVDLVTLVAFIIITFARSNGRLRIPNARIVGAIIDSPVICIALAGFLVFAASSATGLWRGIAVPRVADEFCNLYAADTYNHGRLTNPASPFWRHFEAIHILPQPTMMSKYPPGQSLVLAIGQYTVGAPIVGVWLSLGLAAAALCWMLEAYVAPRWALLGSLCFSLRLAVGYWGQSYWGGALPMLAGSLLFGSTARLVKKSDFRMALVFGVAVSILSITRPFEGLIATIVASCQLMGWPPAWMNLAGSKEPTPPRFIGVRGVASQFWSLAVPVAGVLLPVGGWIAYDNSVVTHKWCLLPYQAHDSIYAACPTFLFQTPRAIPSYDHKDMEDYYVNWERSRFYKKRLYFGFNASYATKLWIFLKFYVTLLLAVPFITALCRSTVRGVRIAAVALVAGLLVMSQTLYLHPHYLAPFSACVALITTQGLRMMSKLGPKRRSLAVAMMMAAFVAPVMSGLLSTNPTSSRREVVAKMVEQNAGKHLVFVRFGPTCDVHECWIYNSAQVEDARIVWARSINEQADDQLRHALPDHSIWDLSIEQDEYRLSHRVELAVSANHD